MHENPVNDEIFTTLLGSWNVLNIAMNMKKFDKWLLNEYGVSFENVSEGYKNLLESTLNTFLFILTTDQSLGLEEDFVFYRARFKGVNIDKFPSTCEKSHLIKNIYIFKKKILKAKNLDEVEKTIQLFRENVLESFKRIYEEFSLPNNNIPLPKLELLKYATIDVIFTFLNDLRGGIPQGMILDPFTDKTRWWYEDPKFWDYWESNFKGFVYALQFLWVEVLGENIKKTSLVNMSKIKEPRELDDYFEIIEKEVIKPIESKMGGIIGSVPLFFPAEEIPKSVFGDLLKKPKGRKLKLNEYLDYLFLWYPIEVIDCSNDLIFNSSPTILSLIIGHIHLRRKYNNNDKVYMIKFIHPSSNGNKFTYSILIESRGMLSDYSGWLVFFDCCGDFSGFNFHLYQQIEENLREYQDSINLIEYKISIDKLRKYLMNKSSLRSKLNLWNMLKDARADEIEIMNKGKGILTELLSFYMEYFNNPKAKVRLRKKYNKREYDIVVERDDLIKIIECKVNLENTNMTQEIQKLKEKMRSYPSNKAKAGYFYTWESIRPEIVRRLKDENIGYKILSDEININKAFRNLKAKDIIQFFEFGKSDKKLLRELKKYLEGREVEDFEKNFGGV